MTTNTNEQVYKDLILSYNDISGDKSISVSANAISFTKNKLTTPVTTYLNQNGIQVDANSSSWQNLSLLDDVLASCEMPPNPTTLKLNNTLLLDSGNSTTLTANDLSLNLVDGDIATNNLTAGDMTINDYNPSTVPNM
jgi:hypothetical protein